MRLRPWLLVGALVLTPVLASCQAPGDESSPPSDAPPPGTVWRTVGAWSGRGDRQTESFDIDTGALRIAWEGGSEPAGRTGRLRVTLHSAISGRPLETVVDQRGSGADTVYVAAEPRVAYLLVESAQIDWRLTLQEGAPPGGDRATRE